MDGKGFQVLVAQLSDLSGVQRAALITALKRRLPADEALQLIDTHFLADPCCGHCRSKNAGGWSAQGGLKRHRFLAAAKDVKAKVVKGIVEADETFIRKSVKGSKRLVGRAPRKRGEKARPGLSSDDYAPVLVVRDRHGATLDHVLPDLEVPTFVRMMKSVVAQDALLVSDGRAAYGQFADHAGLLHIALNASKGERMYGSYHIQNVNAYISRLKDWLRRFKGVATHYLPTYLGWRRMIEREGDLTPARIVMQATPQAPTSN